MIRRLNKKGFGEDFLVDMASFFVWGLILVVFFLLLSFTLKGCDTKANVNVNIASADREAANWRDRAHQLPKNLCAG